MSSFVKSRIDEETTPVIASYCPWSKSLGKLEHITKDGILLEEAQLNIES